MVVGLGVAGVVAGVASFALDAIDVVSPDTAADLGLISLGAATAAVVIGFVGRRRVRLAREGMVVGLATLGGWFLLLVYALSQDTP
jgi:hypothetical protein